MGDDANDFSVDVMYNLLCNIGVAIIDKVWCKIRKLCSPERVRCFIWLLNHDRILTIYNKSGMGIRHVMCHYCGDRMETGLHVFRDYPIVMQIWSNFMPSDRNSFFHGEFMAWIQYNLNYNFCVVNGVKWRYY